MSKSPIRIWVAADYHSAFLIGGWAYVRETGGVMSGAAGGERRTTAARTELAGLAACLADLPAGEAIIIHTPSATLAAAGPLIAGTASGDEAPSENLDLWARVISAAKGRSVRLVRTPVQPKTPMAFSAAWADLARDKAKMKGDFVSPIPKPNLTKVMGL